MVHTHTPYVMPYWVGWERSYTWCTEIAPAAAGAASTLQVSTCYFQMDRHCCCAGRPGWSGVAFMLALWFGEALRFQLCGTAGGGG